MIIITCKQPGFRRCGVAHPAEPTEYPDDAFTGEQLAALHAEPMLMVQETGEEEAERTSKPVSAADMITLVKKATSEELTKLADGETRTTVLAAIEARRKELEA